ncbi:S8 family serine peptidase [Bacillus sp. BAU-SS-2023]|nr:S8 family serine peptidase [Bacillus sp. BAU-SS-2023]
MKNNNFKKRKTFVRTSFFAAIISIILFIYFFSSINIVRSKSFKIDENQDIKIANNVPKNYLSWGMKSINYNNLELKKHVNIKIALLDSGVNEHKDLNGVVKATKNFTNSDEKDNLNHGTPIAGILASNNNLKGILNDIDIYNAKVINDNGSIEEENIINAIDWAIEKDIDIINMSFGFKHPSKKLENKINYAVQKNIIIVASAGNRYGLNTDYPAKYENVISVGSIDSNLELSKFNPDGKIDFLAPGEKILSTCNMGEYKLYTGTSFSAPFVTGIIGRYLSASNIKKDEHRFEKVYKHLLKHSTKKLFNNNFNIIQCD